MNRVLGGTLFGRMLKYFIAGETMKAIVRRISAGVIVLAFFLPWFNFKNEVSDAEGLFEIVGLGSLIELSGKDLVFKSKEFKAILEMGDVTSIANVISVILFVMIGLAVWTLISAEEIPTTLLLVLSTILLVIIYLTEEIPAKSFGMTLTLLGVIGVYASVFISSEIASPFTKKQVNKPIASLAERDAYTASQAEGRVHTTRHTSTRKFCRYCGNKVNTYSKFCTQCGKIL